MCPTIVNCHQMCASTEGKQSERLNYNIVHCSLKNFPIFLERLSWHVYMAEKLEYLSIIDENISSFV